MHLVNKYNGKPFRPIEIIEAIERHALLRGPEPAGGDSPETEPVRVKR
jgi:hypothetical protein